MGTVTVRTFTGEVAATTTDNPQSLAERIAKEVRRVKAQVLNHPTGAGDTPNFYAPPPDYAARDAAALHNIQQQVQVGEDRVQTFKVISIEWTDASESGSIEL